MAMGKAIKALHIEESARHIEEEVYNLSTIAKVYGTSVELETRGVVVHLSYENLLDLLGLIQLNHKQRFIDNYSLVFEKPKL